MEKTRFTPGPWEVREYSGFADYSKAVTTKDGIVLAEIVNFHNDRENAALIAAAPEMYEMLEYLLIGARELLTAETTAEMERILEKARGEE